MRMIILPPVPPRPAPAVRPTMTPEPESPGNRGVKVIMVEGPGRQPGPPSEPDTEPGPPIVATKAQWDIHNRYQVGQEISAYSATWRKGDPANEIYRSRWQTKGAGDDAWDNTSWTEHANQQVKFSKVLAEGVDEVRFQTQVRDATKDPAVQVNSFASLENVVGLAPLKNEIKTTTSGDTTVGSTLTGTLADYSGGLLPVSELYQWQRSANGTNGWGGITGWAEIYQFNNGATTSYTLIEEDGGDYIRFASKATDRSGTTVYGSGSAIGPVDIPDLKVDIDCAWSPDNIYVVGETISCTTAVFKGGLPPYTTTNYKWQYRLGSDSKWTVTDEIEYGNQQVSVSFKLPATTTEVRLFCSVGDKAAPDHPTQWKNAFSDRRDISDPALLATEIGYVSVTVDDVLVEYGTPVHVRVNSPAHVEATISGDAQPTYKWEARGDYPMMVGQQAATTTLTFPEEGAPTVTLTVLDSTATDSPITYAMSFYVASQAEWDALHPTS